MALLSGTERQSDSSGRRPVGVASSNGQLRRAPRAISQLEHVCHSQMGIPK